MSNTAAHLVDRVLPNVPIRQWVLSLPFELRALAAKRPEVVSAIDRILFKEVQRLMQDTSGPRGGRAGAITFVQRFGGSLNLHVHFHVLFLEGLFTRDGDAPPVFHPTLSPTRGELLDVLTRVRDRVMRWLALHGLDRHDDRHNDADSAADPDVVDACANVALQPGLFDKLEGQAPLRGNDGDHDEPAGLGRNSVTLDGFNLHAAVTVGADDDTARERLVRYCARPPFALDRLTLLPDGRIAYRIKHPRRNATHRILEHIELLARIAALIPPPRHPFMRYHGVLAPSSKWRRSIVPRPDEREAPVATRGASHPTTAAIAAPTANTTVTDTDQASSGAVATAIEQSSPNARPPIATTPPVPPTRTGSSTSTASAPPRAGYARITAAHRERLRDGALLAQTPRLDWAKLLRRTFACDVLVCPRCAGRARILTAIHDPTEARRFLDALDQRSIAPPLPPSGPRDPDESTVDHDLAADDVPEDSAPDSDVHEPPPSSSEPPPPSSRPEAWPPDT